MPADPLPAARRVPRRAMVLLVAVVVAGVGLLTAAALQGATTYYKTPSELVGSPPGGETVRVGGLVVRGSLHHHAATTRFTLSDGATDLHVVTTDVPPTTFREGQGAVVQGRLGTDGIFRAASVIVRHSNEYRPPTSSP